MEKNTVIEMEGGSTMLDALTSDIATGEQFSLNLSGLDRMLWEESIVAGDRAIVGHTPSHLTPWHRFGMRLNKKFGTGKQAFLMAYMLEYVADGDMASKKHYEKLATEKGFAVAFAELFTLFCALRKCDASSVDVCGQVVGSLDSDMEYHSIPTMPDVKSFFTVETLEETISAVTEDGESIFVPVVMTKNGLRPKTVVVERESLQVEYVAEETEVVDAPTMLFREFLDRIRRAGVSQLGAIGKDLFGRGKEIGFEGARELWSLYKAKKSLIESQKSGDVSFEAISELFSKMTAGSFMHLSMKPKELATAA